MTKSFVLVPLLSALALLGGCEKSAESKSEGAEKEEKHEEGGSGHVKLTAAQRENAGLIIAEAGPVKIKLTLPVYGKIAADEETLAHVQPRFPGIVKEVRKRLGDHVEKGDVLAVVESNESLRQYEIKSETTGTVIAKHITLGEFVKDETTIFTVADLSAVWVDLSVFRQDFEKLKEGLPVSIHPGDDAEAIESEVAYISPFGTEGSQTMLARCVVPNPHGDLRPGLFVTAEVSTGEVDAPVAVSLAATQTLEDKTIVFVEESGEFAAREVELGTKDDGRVQVLKGVKAGEKYVAEGSFILKSELLKGELGEE